MPLLAAMMLAQAAVPYQISAADVQACGALAVERNARMAELARRNAALQAKSAELATRQQDIEATRAAVKKQHDNWAIHFFNRKIAAVNAMRNAMKPEVAARDAYVLQSNEVVTAFNAKCVNRDFDPRALDSLPPEQRAALSGKATTRTITVSTQARQ